ncbi:hypothetical protein PAEPH01_0490 [Pancytospora epiphaga]|nr:hypothetical protein PAEPH01_0490 [Pancytospora epiphaga]
MEKSATENTLPYPIPDDLVRIIVDAQPQLGPILVSAIELTIKESQNHYSDVLRSIKPLLKDKTEDFLSKIFSFENMSSKAPKPGFSESSHNTHSTEENIEVVCNQGEVQKCLNSEVIFNKVDESVHTLNGIREYAASYGAISRLRRLNCGKYLIIFEDPKSAQNLINTSKAVLGDINITKFYNVVYKNEPRGPLDIHRLLNEQNHLLEKISDSCDPEIFSSLRIVTRRIRGYVLSKEEKFENNRTNRRGRPGSPGRHTESSLYYNMLNE